MTRSCPFLFALGQVRAPMRGKGPVCRKEAPR